MRNGRFSKTAVSILSVQKWMDITSWDTKRENTNSSIWKQNRCFSIYIDNTQNKKTLCNMCYHRKVPFSTYQTAILLPLPPAPIPYSQFSSKSEGYRWRWIIRWMDLYWGTTLQLQPIEVTEMYQCTVHFWHCNYHPSDVHCITLVHLLSIQFFLIPSDIISWTNRWKQKKNKLHWIYTAQLK